MKIHPNFPSRKQKMSSLLSAKIGNSFFGWSRSCINQKQSSTSIRRIIECRQIIPNPTARFTRSWQAKCIENGQTPYDLPFFPMFLAKAGRALIIQYQQSAIVNSRVSKARFLAFYFQFPFFSSPNYFSLINHNKDARISSAIATSNRKNRMQARRPEARPKKESASPPLREKMPHAFYNDFIGRCKKRSCNKISRNVSIYRSNSVLTFIERLQPTVGSDVRSFKYQFIISAQQYFQQKFNMTTPNSYLSRYSQFQYPLALSPWAIGASNPYAFNPQLSYPSFPQPLNYSYFMPPNAFYPHLQANQMFAGAFPSQPVAQSGAVVRAEERSIGASNKIQKNQKRAQESSVIQISDDQQPAQQGKPCQEKSTSSNNKIIHNDPPINNKTIHHLQKQQPPNPKKQPIPTTTPKHIKPPKTKEICKINNLKKKLKSETLNQECQQKKGQVFSQRIIEKKDAKKQPYRLSKKERQLLEISFLRDVANEILTGPQFQAKLPSFIVQPSPSFGSSHDLQNWKQQLRADLLSRMEKNQE